MNVWYSNYGGKYGRNGGQSQKPSVNCDRSVLTALPGGDNGSGITFDFLNSSHLCLGESAVFGLDLLVFFFIFFLNIFLYLYNLYNDNCS